MPRKISGLDGGTRIPIRGLAKLLNNLPPAEKDRLQSAFTDAENLLDFYDQSVRDKQNKRKLSGLIDNPVLTVEQSILGASVKFNRLNDPRISFYEIQVDDVNTFPDPESLQIIDPFFALDGITTRKFIRARGIRGATGETGNWSETVVAIPTVTAPKAYTCQFYQRYTGSEPNLFKKVRYGGEDTPGFYTLLDCSFYANRLVGGMSCWGMISNRLKKPLNSNVRPWDRLKFTINGITKMESYFPLWTNSFFDDDTPNINPSTGQPLSFYGLGGYTASFGPYNLAVPIIERGQGPLDPTAFDELDAPGALFYWKDEGLIFRPSRLDTGQLEFFDDITNKGREAEAGIGTNATTSYLIAKNFKFAIPEDEEITGIDVRIKRRQLNYPATPRDLLPLQHETRRSVTNGVQFDYGLHPNKRLLESNFNQSDTFSPAVTLENILKDVDYGRFIELSGAVADTNMDYLGTSGRGGLTVTPQVGTVDNFNTFIANNPWTISTWVNPYFVNGDSLEQIWAVAGYTNAGGTTNPLMRLIRGRPPGAGTDRLALSIDMSGGFSQRYNNVFTVMNKWYHIVATWTGANLFIFVDRQRLNPAVTTGSYPGFQALNATFGAAFGYYQPTAFAGLGRFNGGVGQTGIWNVSLPEDAIRQLFDMRMNFDYRYDYGNYIQSLKLQHYYLYLPEEPQISDHEIFLHDSSGVRTDLDNKAVTELWPQLDEFFYAVTFTPDGRLQARSQGIPHDNVIGIGYQTYGGPFDLWGMDEAPTREAVADGDFGVAIRAKNGPRAFPGVGYVDHVKMTVYTAKPGNNDVRLQVWAEAANQFYIEREVFGGLFNVIESGEVPLND